MLLIVFKGFKSYIYIFFKNITFPERRHVLAYRATLTGDCKTVAQDLSYISSR